jgi:hypothetical protein
MPSESDAIDAEAEIDRLFQGPAQAFVEARNALAARLKSSGDKEAATRVKALARPNVPAWAANQVYWTARREFDGLVVSMDRLQKAQLQSGAGGAALREAMKSRREALDAVVRRAQSLLVDAGMGAPADVLLRVANTLEALAAEAGRKAQVRPGRLARELEPPGFDAFAAMAEADPTTLLRGGGSEKGRPTGPSDAGRMPKSVVTPLVPEPADEARARKVEALRTALAEAERRLDRVRREAAEASAALSVAAKRAEAASAELEEAKRRFERARDRAALTAQDEAAAGRKAAELSAARDVAEADRDAARHALRAVE